MSNMIRTSFKTNHSNFALISFYVIFSFVKNYIGFINYDLHVLSDLLVNESTCLQATIFAHSIDIIQYIQIKLSILSSYKLINLTRIFNYIILVTDKFRPLFRLFLI